MNREWNQEWHQEQNGKGPGPVPALLALPEPCPPLPVSPCPPLDSGAPQESRSSGAAAGSSGKLRCTLWLLPSAALIPICPSRGKFPNPTPRNCPLCPPHPESVCFKSLALLSACSSSAFPAGISPGPGEPGG